MPYASTRVSRNTRIGGGPVFWFFYAMFAMPLWVMWQMLRGAILLVAWLVRQAGAQKPATPAAPVSAVQPAEPQDAIPEDARPSTPRAEPAKPSRAVPIGLAAAACTLLVVLVILGKVQM